MSNSARRAERMNAFVNENAIISTRAYNVVMGLVVLYGLVVNFVLCATVGADIYYSINPLMFIVLYFVLALGGTFIALRSDNPLVSFLGYNMVVLPLGIMISAVVEAYGGVSSSVVLGAIYYTMLITAIMVLSAMLFPGVFARLGGVLFVALIGLIITGFISMFTGLFYGVYSIIGAVIFSLYIGYDFYRSQQFPKTLDNAVDCALDIYLDIINLFLFILRILGNGSSSNSRAK
ncbi:MAG: Bax inhibitor-1 family protein [Eubacterium sp.]|nr:Bax inhibitor-1 family protein [Eubacterium sp.]